MPLANVTLVAALPVKDEVRSIAATIESLLTGCDGVLVYDTGSTDGTVDLVRETFERGPSLHPLADVAHGGGARFRGGESGSPRCRVCLINGQFVDYAQMRESARGAAERVFRPDWVLSASADERLVSGGDLHEFLREYAGDETALLLEVRTPAGAIDFPRILRAGSSWRYEGEIHECPRYQPDRAREPTVKVPGWIEYAPSDPARNLRRLRERDVPILERLFEVEPDPAGRVRIASHIGGAMEALATEGESSLARRCQALASALGWYLLAAMDDTAPDAARAHAQFRLVEVGRALGIYLPTERLVRLGLITTAQPNAPEVVFSVAECLSDIASDTTVPLPDEARNGLLARAAEQARRAALLARAAVRDPARPHDPHGLLWRTWKLAAVCARSLGDEAGAHEAAAQGVAAGGAEDQFKDFLNHGGVN